MNLQEKYNEYKQRQEAKKFLIKIMIIIYQ